MTNIIHTSMGGLLTTVFLGTILYGILSVQVLVYSQSHTGRMDPLWMKCLIGGLCVFVTTQTGLSWAHLFDRLVNHFGDVHRLQTSSWMLCAAILLSGWSCALVQAFFTYRLHIISNNIRFALPAWLAQVFWMALHTMNGIQALRLGATDYFWRTYMWSLVAAFATSAIVDVWNAGMLCWQLYRQDNDAKTNRVVNRLMVYSFETGLITCSLAMTVVLLLSITPDTGLWIGVLFIYAKLHVVVMMASLNRRISLRAQELENTVYTTPTIHFATHPSHGHVISHIAETNMTTNERTLLPPVTEASPTPSRTDHRTVKHYKSVPSTPTTTRADHGSVKYHTSMPSIDVA